MRLVLFTTTSPLLEHLAYQWLRRFETVIMDTDVQVHARLKEIGLSSIMLRSPGDSSWENRDRSFAKLAMPGVQLDKPFLNTNLPMWKVLSLDRYSFWYRGEQAKREYESIMAMNWETALVPMDLGHPLNFSLARHSGRRVIGVACGSLRTREWHDLAEARLLPYTKMVVSRQQDLVFLHNQSYQNVDLIDMPDPVVTAVSPERKAAARSGWNIPQSDAVALILFDSQCEWEFRQSIPMLKQQYQRLLVYPVHWYDSKNIQLFTGSGMFQVANDISAETVADDIIAYRYDYNLFKDRVLPVKIFDISGRFLSATLAQ